MKSPLSANLSSPPHGSVSKAGTPSPHVVSPDLPLTSSTSSSSFSSSTVGVTGGGTGGGGGGGNTHLGPSSGVALKSVSSQPALTQSTVSISQTPHNSHILNGPHYSSMSAPGPAARDSTTNLTAGGLSLPQNNVMGPTMSTQIQLPSHSVGHPALTAAAAAQTPMMKVRWHI